VRVSLRAAPGLAALRHGPHHGPADAALIACPVCGVHTTSPREVVVGGIGRQQACTRAGVIMSAKPIIDHIPLMSRPADISFRDGMRERNCSEEVTRA
jgi:hypothetical protein